MDLSKTDDDDCNDDEEDEIIADCEKSRIAKNKHDCLKVIGAFDMIQPLAHEENLPFDRRLALDRLRCSANTRQMQKPKVSPTIKNFFQPFHKS